MVEARRPLPPTRSRASTAWPGRGASRGGGRALSMAQRRATRAWSSSRPSTRRSALRRHRAGGAAVRSATPSAARCAAPRLVADPALLHGLGVSVGSRSRWARRGWWCGAIARDGGRPPAASRSRRASTSRSSSCRRRPGATAAASNTGASNVARPASRSRSRARCAGQGGGDALEVRSTRRPRASSPASTTGVARARARRAGGDVPGRCRRGPSLPRLPAAARARGGDPAGARRHAPARGARVPADAGAARRRRGRAGLRARRAAAAADRPRRAGLRAGGREPAHRRACVRAGVALAAAAASPPACRSSQACARCASQLFAQGTRPELPRARAPWSALPAVLLFAVVCFWRAPSLVTGAWFAGLFGASLALLTGCGVALMRALARLPAPRSLTLRHALRELARGGTAALACFVALALTVLLQGLAPQLRASLTRDLEARELARCRVSSCSTSSRSSAKPWAGTSPSGARSSPSCRRWCARGCSRCAASRWPKPRRARRRRRGRAPRETPRPTRAACAGAATTSPIRFGAAPARSARGRARLLRRTRGGFARARRDLPRARVRGAPRRRRRRRARLRHPRRVGGKAAS